MLEEAAAYPHDLSIGKNAVEILVVITHTLHNSLAVAMEDEFPQAKKFPDELTAGESTLSAKTGGKAGTDL